MAISWYLFVDIFCLSWPLCHYRIHNLVPVTDSCWWWGWIRSEWGRNYLMIKHITNYVSGCQTHDLWIVRPHNTYEACVDETFVLENLMHYLTTCSMGHNPVIHGSLVTKHVMLIRYVLLPLRDTNKDSIFVRICSTHA